MRMYVYATNLGEVTRTLVTGVVPTDTTWVYSSGNLTQNFDNTYYDGTDFIPVPSSPGINYSFNYGSKTWVLDPALEKRNLSIDRHSIRTQAIQEGFLFDSTLFQIDLNSRTSISGKVVYLQVNTQVDTVYWKAMDNSVVTFTTAEFLVFASAVSDYYENLILAT
jgi:hypothetical protein